LDNSLLNEYAAMKAEIKNLRRGISRLKHEIKNPPSLFHKKQEKMMELVMMLESREIEFLDMTIEVERFIETIEKSEMRIMFRLYYIEDYSYIKVADEMNQMFPRRSIAYSDENVKKRIQRYLVNVPQCAERKCRHAGIR